MSSVISINTHKYLTKLLRETFPLPTTMDIIGVDEIEEIPSDWNKIDVPILDPEFKDHISNETLICTRVLEHLLPQEIHKLSQLYNEIYFLVPDMLEAALKMKSSQFEPILKRIRISFEIVNEVDPNDVSSIRYDTHKWFTCEDSLNRVFPDLKIISRDIYIGGYRYIFASAKSVADDITSLDLRTEIYETKITEEEKDMFLCLNRIWDIPYKIWRLLCKYNEIMVQLLPTHLYNFLGDPTQEYYLESLVESPWSAFLILTAEDKVRPILSLPMPYFIEAFAQMETFVGIDFVFNDNVVGVILFSRS
jgi:hypothetical protein